MTAYELADEYEYTKKEHDAFMENPTDANKIAVLCKRDEFLQKLIRQQADRIAELEKEKRIDGIKAAIGKPVGWIGYFEGKVCSFIYEEEQVNEFLKNTDPCGKVEPVYSAPQTKPLSNDEILEMTIWNKNLYELYVEMEKEDMIAFARAIEERHGIK